MITALLLNFIVVVILWFFVSDRRFGGVFSAPFWMAVTFTAYDFLQSWAIFLYDGYVVMETFLPKDRENTLIFGSIIVCCAAIFWLIGYALGLKDTKITQNYRLKVIYFDGISIDSVGHITAFFSFFAILSSIIYANLVGINLTDFDNLFSKRVVRTEEGKFLAYGYLRQLAGIGLYGFIVFFAFFLFELRNARKIKLLNYIYLIAAIVASIFFPLITSSRGALVSLVISATVAIHFIFKKMNFFRMFFVGIFSLLILGVLKKLRLSSADMIDSSSNFDYGIWSPFLYGGGQSVFNTGVIAEFYEKNGYEWGGTMAGIFLAPIPRSLWPEKPQVSPDQFIAEIIYGYSGDGWYLVPPGFAAEAYMNFGLLGVIILFFILGNFCSAVFGQILQDIRIASPTAMVFYLVAIKAFTKLLGSSLSAVIIDTCIAFFSVSVILILAKNFSRNRVSCHA